MTLWNLDWYEWFALGALWAGFIVLLGACIGKDAEEDWR